MSATRFASGQQLDPLVVRSGFAAWNRYAAVNDEFVSIHMSNESARRAGLPEAVGMGNWQWSLMHVALRSWFGDAAAIKTVECRFQRPATRGNIRVHGKIVDTVVSSGDPFAVQVDVWLENADAEVLTTGHATVELTMTEFD